MGDKPWRNWTDDELAAAADTGLRGQGAAVEALRRLRDRLDLFSASSDKYSRRMFWLNIILAVLTLVQAIAVVPVIKGWFK
jgi:hypothetical protein